MLHFNTSRHSERCPQYSGTALWLTMMRGIAWSNTKVLPYHRPIVFACAGVVLSP